MSVSEVKQKRGRQLGALTRLRRQAFVLIDGRGSRSSLASILSDLNTALGKLEELNPLRPRHIERVSIHGPGPYCTEVPKCGSEADVVLIFGGHLYGFVGSIRSRAGC